MKKISRKKFLEEKFKKWKKFLEKKLPSRAYKLEFEDFLNQLKDILC